MGVIVVLPAAGFGSRMQSAGTSKQYLLLGDRPILAHTLAHFEQHPLVDRIVITVPAADLDFCRTGIVARYAFRKVTQLVPGGPERQDSVRNGLEACDGTDGDIVLIHDGVRPFVSPQLISATISATGEHGACVVGMPVKDTIKHVRDGLIIDTPERSTLWVAQTPQAFRFPLIQAAHLDAQATGFLGTDDASLVERLGHPVVMIPGDYRNIKITTPDDLLVARGFLHGHGAELR